VRQRAAAARAARGSGLLREPALDGPLRQWFLEPLEVAGLLGEVWDGATGASFGHRLRRYWELREMGGVRHALRYDPAELDDALPKLRAEAVLSPG
jgi:hypothetical protein